MLNRPSASARAALSERLTGSRAGFGRVLAEAIPWGDSGATLRWDGDGDVRAARWHDGRDGQVRAVRSAARAGWLADLGIPLSGPTTVFQVDDPIGAWTVSPWCVGTLGARLIGDPVEGPGLAATMGALSAQISRLPPVGTGPLALDSTWASPSSLAEAAEHWVGLIREALDPRTHRALAVSIEQIAAREIPWHAGVVHGDLVPINMIVIDDHRLVVLDLEHMAIGPPTLDPAWWSWVVRLHHPDAWGATWPTFLAATGLTGPEADDGLLTAIGRIRALQRTIEAPQGSGRSSWVERLTATAGW